MNWCVCGVVQAMASGSPVGTSACHGVDMFCLDKYSALIVPPTDVIAMGQAVVTLLRHPEVIQR